MKSLKLSTIRDARLKIAKPYTRRDLATNLYNFISYSKTEGTPLNWILKTFAGCKTDDLLQALGELSFNGDIVPLTKGTYTIAKYAGGLGQIKEPWQMTQEEYVLSYATTREKAHEMYGKPAGKTLDIALVVETAKEVHENIIKDAVQKGFPVPEEVLQDYPELMPVEKEHWQMTRQEFYVIGDVEEYRDKTFGQYGRDENIFRDGVTRLQNAHKELLETGQAKHAVALWEAAKWRDASEKKHEATIKQALAAGKPVPVEVLRDYPDLKIPQPPLQRGYIKAEPRRPQSKPLPPDAQNIQTVPFDSQLFDCYGKPTRRGFRAYCRRK